MESLFSMFGISGGSGGGFQSSGAAKAYGGDNSINSIIGKNPMFIDYESIITKVVLAMILLFLVKTFWGK